jgi:hypothetical protein
LPSRNSSSPVLESTRHSGGHEAIRSVVDWLDSFQLDDVADRATLSAVFDQTLAVAARLRPGRGEFTAPLVLTDLAVALAEPRIGEKIYDPCFGTGSFLAAAARRIASETDKSVLPLTHPSNSFFGVEAGATNHLIARARLLLEGINNPVLRIGSLVDKSTSTWGSFDCVFAIPPFGRNVRSDPPYQLPFRTRTSEALVLQHIMGSLRIGGRAAVVLPESTLFRRGPEVGLRRALLEEFCVESVWSLPVGTFLPYTSVKCSLVLFRKAPPRPEIVFFSENLTREIFPRERLRRSGIDQTLLPAEYGDVAELSSRDQLSVTGSSSLAKSSSNAYAHLSTLARFLQHRNLDSDTLAQFSWSAIEAWPLLSKLASSKETVFGMEWARRFREFRNEVVHGTIRPDHRFYTRLRTLLHEYMWTVPVSQLEARHWELVAKRTGEDGLNEFLDKLQAQTPNARRTTLGEIAEVFLGVHYMAEGVTEIDRPELWPQLSGDRPQISQARLVPLIRVQDISRDGKSHGISSDVRRPSIALNEAGMAKIRDQQRLRQGDILVSASGTVGNIGVVPHLLGGAVAAKSIIVVRPAEIGSNLALARLLQSGPYQEWFKGNSSGSVIRYLSIRVLQRTPVLVLPVDQQRILAAKLGPDSDEAAVLDAFSSLSGDSLVASALTNEPVLRSLVSATGTEHSSLWWANLHNAVRLARRLIYSAGEEVPGDTLRRAFANWTGHASKLLEVLDLPEGMERYALLQAWDKVARRDLMESQTEIEDEESLAPGVLRIRALSDTLLGAASAELERLAASVSLVIVPEDSDVWAGPSAEVTIVLQNSGAAPILRLQVETTLEVPGLRLPLLSGGARKNWTLPLGDAPPGPINFGIRWTGEDLAGTVLGGSLDLSIDLKEQESGSELDTFKANPYIVGSPIDDDRNFYGRADVLDQIERSLRQSGPSTVILLEGNRRVGKTSILKQLRSRVPGWIPIYCQFQGMSGAPSARNVYRLVAKELLQTLQSVSVGGLPEELAGLLVGSTVERRRYVQGLVGTIEDGEPFGRFEELLQLSIQAARPKRLLLMLDEFEKIHEGIEQKQIPPEIPETFRYLFHTYPEVSGILSGSRRIKRMRQEYWNVLFGIGKPIWVRSLDRPSSKRLVSEPVSGRIAYSEAALDHLLDLCACQPFLLQSLASTVFEICAVARQTSVTVATVEEASLSLVLDNEHFYTIFKQEALTDRRRFLACLIDKLADGPDRVTFQLIRDQLEVNGLEYRSEVRLKEDLEELQELELLSESTDDSFRIEVPLFSRWLRTRVNFEAQLSAALEEEAP